MSAGCIVVGAGVAGLSAASYLTQHRYPGTIVILEARNRLGGRVASLLLGNQRVELGAQWIHGVLGNPVYEVALQHHLIDINLERRPHNVLAATQHGRRVPFNVIKEVYEAYYQFTRHCEQFFMCDTLPPTGVTSVGALMERDIAEYLNSHAGEDRHIRRMIFDHLLHRECCVSGCHSPYDLDLNDFGSYVELPGGNLSIDGARGGFSAVVDCLKVDLPPDSIHLEHTVKKIRWHHRKKSDGDEASCEDKETVRPALVTVECDNGKVFTAEHVIVTLPLGVLKERARDIFEPPLPDYKQQAIDRLLFGTVNKLFLEYERPFLHPDIHELVLLWERDPQLRSLYQPTYSTQNCKNSDKSAQCDEISEEERRVLSDGWYKKIYSFRKVSDTLLLAWLAGKEAIFVETISAEDIATACTDILRKFLNDPCIPKPKRVIRTRWHSEVNTRGSYTSIGVGSSQKDIIHLGQPIYASPYQEKPTLLFAGEATHPTFYSTTHGALLSGRQAGQLLLEQPTELATEQTVMSSWVDGISLS